MNGNPGMARAIRGPVTLITLGVLFALNNFTPYHFGETWPVLLIVFGALSLPCRAGRSDAPPSTPYGYPPPPPRPGDPGTPPPVGEKR
ncbi:MAG TPA: DUF5668 domain-containing protein [Bryobacteraceae bacterium]|nr:DUF5668 domain-containing protein [Bryobacteraceae bacterium]